MSDKNPFGGKNARSLYVPMSEIEQEFVDRLRVSGDLRVTLVGWGRIDNPVITQGDHQVVIPIDITFNAPAAPIPVHSFELELSTHSGMVLFRETQSAEYGLQPLMVGAGTHLQMLWHIGIRMIDPKIIKAYMPGVHGLTSRNVDKDTGDLTVLGNMRLDSATRHLLETVRRGEKVARRDNASAVARGKRK